MRKEIEKERVIVVAKRTAFTCDRCSADIAGDPTMKYRPSLFEGGKEGPLWLAFHSGAIREELDLCDSCLSKVIDFLDPERKWRDSRAKQISLSHKVDER
jgi:hypothetical protein